MSVVKLPVTFAGMSGSGLVGALVNCMFYGIALVVTAQYARRHAKGDPLYVKVMVGLMILLATLQTIFINHQTYTDLISNHNSTQGRFAPIPFSLPAKFLCVYLITFIAQVFFVTRIWTLTEHIARGARLALIPIMGLALLQITSGSAIVNLEVTSKTLAELGTHSYWNKTLTGLQGASTAACDVVITTTLCYLYHAHRSVSSRVNSTIDRLVIYAVNRAAATSICATLAVIFFFCLSGSYYFVIPTYMTGQLYVISAISVLTSRESLRDVNDPTVKDDSDHGSVTKFEASAYGDTEKQV